MRKIVAVLVIITMILFVPACSSNVVRGSVSLVSENGDAVLDIMPQKLTENINVGETVEVIIGDFCEKMLFSDEWIDDDGKLQLFFDRDEWCIRVCSLDGDFCEAYGVAAGENVTIQKAK